MTMRRTSTLTGGGSLVSRWLQGDQVVTIASRRVGVPRWPEARTGVILKLIFWPAAMSATRP